jgi:hypothetical protein
MRNLRIPLRGNPLGCAMSRVLVGALAAAVVLGGTIYWEMQDAAQPDIAATTSGRSPLMGTVRAAPGLATIDVVQGWETTALGRPLFREDRRPPKNAKAVVANGGAPPRLTGVITGPFGNRAIFTSGESPNPIVATEGARVGDFVVRSIQPDQVIVESEGALRTMKPSFAEGAATTTPRR